MSRDGWAWGLGRRAAARSAARPPTAPPPLTSDAPPRRHAAEAQHGDGRVDSGGQASEDEVAAATVRVRAAVPPRPRSDCCSEWRAASEPLDAHNSSSRCTYVLELPSVKKRD